VPIDEVAIGADLTDGRTRALLDVADAGLRPWQVVAASADPASSAGALLAAREARPEPTAWVCRGGACQLPVTTADGLRAQLRGGPG